MVVAVRAHFDTNLQRVLYKSNPDPTLGRAIVTVRTCDWCNCGKAPMYMLLQYTDFVDCECVYSPNYTKWLKTTGVAAVVNNLIMRVQLTQTETPCYYESWIAGDFGKMESFNDAECSILYNTATFNRIENTVLLYSTCVYVWSFLRSTVGGAFNLFRGDIMYVEGDHCGNTDETAANIANDCITHIMNYDSPCFPILQNFLAPFPCNGSGIAHVGVPD